MNHCRIVGLDLGMPSAHTVRVLDGEGTAVARRKAWPTLDSLTQVETPPWPAARPAPAWRWWWSQKNPAWLPIAVFFAALGGCATSWRSPLQRPERAEQWMNAARAAAEVRLLQATRPSSQPMSPSGRRPIAGSTPANWPHPCPASPRWAGRRSSPPSAIPLASGGDASFVFHRPGPQGVGDR